MALFSRKPKTEKKAGAPVEKAVAVQSAARPVALSTLAHVLVHARITEKASMLQGSAVYSFDVAGRATKADIALAIKSLYGVTPRKVAVVSIKKKKIRNVRTGKGGIKGGGKKAYVYLKSGETIAIS